MKDLLKSVKFRTILCSTFIFGLIAHAYAYLNVNISHDSLYEMNEPSAELMISVGKFVRPLYRLIRGNIALPWLGGLLSLLFIGLSTYLITELLDITDKFHWIIVSGILVANYSVSLLNATYIHDADAYGLALLLSVFGLWVANKQLSKNKFINIFLPIIFYVLSLGIYQSYIDVVIFIILIKILYKLINKEDLKETFLYLLKQMLLIAVSMAAYYLIFRLILAITGIEPYSGHEGVINVLNLSNIYLRFYNTLYSEKNWLLRPKAHNELIITVLNLSILLISAYIVINQITKNKYSKKYILFIILVILIMPFGLNAITLISGESHDITTYSFILIYVFSISLCENYKLDKKINSIVLLLVSLVIVDSCIYSNEIYLKKDLESKTTLSTYTRIIDRMELTEGYELGKTEVAFFGTLSKSELSQDRDFIDNSGSGLKYNFSTTHESSLESYFNYYLSYPIVFASDEKKSQIEQTQEYKEMKSFPDKDSVQFIEGVLVVKLSDEEY